MKLVLLFLLMALSTNALAQFNDPSNEQFGLGVIIGSPTGISGNYMLSESNSIDGALAYDLGDDENLHLHGSYLWRHPKSIRFDGEAMGWYWGLGAKFRTHNRNKKDQYDDEDFRFGPRASVGMNYEFSKAPVEVFGEVALIMYLIESTDLDADIALGLRYYF